MSKTRLNNQHPILAREGWWHIFIALLLAMLVHFFFGFLWSLPWWLFLVFNLQFFRDPKRNIPELDGAVLAPADGKIIFIGEVNNPYLDRPALKISVFMNVFSVHSNRSPVSGEIRKRWYQPGAFFNAALDKASNQNERNALWVQTDGQDIVFVQVAGLIARRILCYVNEGDTIQAGQRFGFIRFGSRVDLYLPPHCRLHKKLGDWVSAGSDVLGYLP